MTGALDYRRAALCAAVFFDYCRPSLRDGTARIVDDVVHVALYYIISYMLYNIYMNGARNNTAIISSISSLGHLSVGFFSTVNPYRQQLLLYHTNRKQHYIYYYIILHIL
jgi:hypothetical protein